MLTIKLADPLDAAELARVQKITFDHDVRQYQNKEEDGPPGYSSEEWQAEQMCRGHYYKLLAEEQIVGGMILFPDPGGEKCHLGRIFIDPLYQNRGYGQTVFRFLFESYPAAQIWTLDTPFWAVRNHYFYQKLGFIKTGEILDTQSGETIIEYERRC